MNALDVLASFTVLGAVLAGLSGLAGAPVYRLRPRSTGRHALVLGIGVASAASTIAIVHGPPVLRVPLAVLAVLVAPGLSVVVFRRLDDLLDELTLALGLSFAALVLLGTLMVSVGFWEPGGLVALMGLVTSPILTRQGVSGLRSRVTSGAGCADV